MSKTARTVVVVLCLGISEFYVSCLASGAPPSEMHAVIIRAVGALPGQDKAAGADAVTHATTDPMNTYVFTEELAKCLAGLDVETRIIDFSDCRNLECLLAQPSVENSRNADILILAGPSHNSKFPNQLLSLFPKLGEIAESAPNLVCSSLVAAWYPDTKGVATAAQADRAFKAAKLQTVEGISLLTPRQKKRGIKQKALEKELADFAERLVAKAQRDAP